jgi:hypothetical protein
MAMSRLQPFGRSRKPKLAPAASRKPKTAARGYGGPHQQLRAHLAPQVASGLVRCWRCCELIGPGEDWHLGHVDGDKARYAGPEHVACNTATAGRRPWMSAPAAQPQRDGLHPDDPRWDVPWLDELRDVPADAVWPRLMTIPHPRAVGSLGAEFCQWAQARSGHPLRWWQRLVATRLFEHDSDERLVWETMVLSMARQLGKSWLLRELLFWRMHQGERFGEPQDVMHTGKEVAICKEVQRPARVWAKSVASSGVYRVREVNGQEEIELLADGSRWMVRAKEAVYGYSVSCAAADEAWKVPASSIDEGLAPTMTEREQWQLLLVSTAHRLATGLMIGRRQFALADLEGGDGDLLLEWSAPAVCALDDIEGWRLASPHWTQQRERLISKRYQAMLMGESADLDEVDPEQSFRAQWLNQWPARKTELPGAIQDLLAPGLWGSLVEPGLTSREGVFVAVEDDYGLGAAVACAAATGDGRFEVDGWLCADWNSAIEDVKHLATIREILELHVGASLLDRLGTDGILPIAQPATAAQARTGLALLRDLANNRLLVHDITTSELDNAIRSASVKEAAVGLQLMAQGPTHLVKAAAWALQAAHRPARVPAIH